MRRVFIENEDAGDERKRREHKRLDALIGYCEAPECRRRSLLSYFGETTNSCQNCDVCRDPIETADGSVFGQKALCAIDQSGRIYGAAHIIDILRGTPTEKIAKARHDAISAFGTGSELRKQEWQSIIRQLVAAGLLKLDIQGYGGLDITVDGEGLMRG